MMYFLLLMMFDLITYAFVLKDLQELKQELKQDINRLKIQTNYLLYEKKED